MSPHVRVHQGRDGRLLATKAAWPRSAEHRLVREAAVLAAARHPGVVRCHGVAVRDGHLELHTGWVGTRSLADTGPLPVEQAASVVGAIAATLADLHALGITHGSLDPSHVVLDGRGRPVLCSFARARVHTPEPADRAADVAAVGDLLERLLGPPDDPELGLLGFWPSRRFGRRRAGRLQRHLLTIADHARAHDIAARPTASALAATLAELAPQVAFPATDPRERVAPGPRSDDDVRPPAPLDDLERLRATASTVAPRRRRRWPFGFAVLAALASVPGAVLVATRTGTVAPVPPPAGDVEPAPSPRQADDDPTEARAVHQPSGSTPVVDLAGATYEVGRPGDRAAVGDWRCDGRDTALVLRPSTGELFVFDAPEEAPPRLSAPAFSRLLAATDLVAARPEQACPQPAGIDANGGVHPISLPPRSAA